MATIKTITIEYGYTFNLGNYSSVRPAASFTVELAEGDDVENAVAWLQKKARRAVHDEIDLELMRRGQRPFGQLAEDDVPF